MFLAPIMPVAAFPHDNERSIPERTVEIDGATIDALDLIAWAGAFGAVLLPGVVIPAGQTPSGLPVGVQIVGPYLQDRRLLHIASLHRRGRPGFHRPPGY